MESRRILLRPLRPADLEDFLAYRSDPAVIRFQSFHPFSRAEATRFLEEQQHFQLGQPGRWVQIGIELREEGRLIGDCAVQFSDPDRKRAEIGYTLHPAYQGRGLATEAVGALTAQLFTEYKVEEVTATVDVRNPPSWRLLERLGFEREAVLQDNYYDEAEGAWFDEYRYVLCKGS